MNIRLHKRIADNGYCSRRKAEILMSAGRVKVNGKVVTEMGTKVTENDVIEVESKILNFNTENITMALHKPAGYITTKEDPDGGDTVMDLLPKSLRHLKPIGRLDKESEGLLLLSSDGDLLQRLTHPKYGHTKTYDVLVKGYVKPEKLRPLMSGRLKLDDYELKPMEYRILKSTPDKKTWIRLVLREGRYRQIRRVMDSLGFPVLYLRRIAIGTLTLGRLKKGKFKELIEDEIRRALS